MLTPTLQAPCATIDDVIDRMVALNKRFEAEHGRDDGVRWFNRLYLSVTRGVKRSIARAGYFDDPVGIEQLDVLFAQLYFDAVDAVDAGEPPTHAWRVLFAARDRPGVLPLQFAAAGMNAHINHDLPLALLEQWDTIGARPGEDSPAYADFTKLNQILKAEEAKLKSKLEPELLLELDRQGFGKLEDKLALWIVEEARARAWDAAELLWDVRHLEAVRGAWLATVDGVVGAAGRILLEPI